jgi:hypothetical protein
MKKLIAMLMMTTLVITMIKSLKISGMVTTSRTTGSMNPGGMRHLKFREDWRYENNGPVRRASQYI